MHTPGTSGYGSIKGGAAAGPSSDFETSGYTTTNSRGSQGARSWRRAGLMIAAAATALSAAVATVHFTANTTAATNEQQLPRSSSVGATPQQFAAKTSAESLAPAVVLGNNKNTPVTTKGNNKRVQQAGRLPEKSGGKSAEHVVVDVPIVKKPAVAETAPSLSAQPSASQSLAFTASNEYNRRGDSIGLGYPWLEGEILVEPHRSTSLEVVSPVEGMVYSWQIVETVDPGETIVTLGDFQGDVVEVVFGRAPKYTVVLIETAESDEGVTHLSNRRTEVEIFCKYVRREIRSLFDDERNEMFDAMKV